MHRLRKVYVVPTSSNRIMVEKLKKMPLLDQVAFELLPSADGESSERLISGIGDKHAVLMWGDGHEHHYSFYFDIGASNGKRKVKRNIDLHEDELGVVTAIPRSLPPLNFANHITHSYISHEYACIGLAVPVSRRAKRNECDGHSKIFPYVLPGTLYDTDALLHLTIDCDSIRNFPSYSMWITQDGFGLGEISDGIKLAKNTGNLIRLDFGGLVHGIPDFEYSEPAGVPGHDAMHLFSYSVARVDIRREIPREDANLAGSYALHCYYNILKAALFD